MKKTLLLILALSLALTLAACGTAARPAPPADTPVSGGSGETVTARIMENDGDGLLLAGLAAPYEDVYTVSLADLEEAGVYTEGLRPGERVELAFDGAVEETFPAKLGNVTGVWMIEDGRDRLYQLYLDVLDDLWKKDPALRDGITQIGFDLGSTRLTGSEQRAAELLFARDHGDLEVVTGTWQDLADAGIIDGENLVWEDGVLLSIKEKNDEYGQVLFDAELWRSGLGAYLFCDCTSRQLIGGDWEPCQIGSEAIS